MIEIKEFCDKYEIERRVEKRYGYSDLYVAIFERYESELKIWYKMEKSGESCKHMMRSYREVDLKEYFKESLWFQGDYSNWNIICK